MANTSSSQPEITDLTAQTLRIYWRHAMKYWPMLLLCVAGVGTLLVCELASPFFYKRFFDLLAIDPLHKAERGNLTSIYHAIAEIAAVSVFAWAGWRACIVAANVFESRTMKDLTDYCFSYLQNHSHRFFTDNFAGALVKRVNRFASGFETIADQCVFSTGQTAIRVVLIVGVLFWRNRTIGLVFLVWTVVFVGFNYYFARWK